MEGMLFGVVDDAVIAASHHFAPSFGVNRAVLLEREGWHKQMRPNFWVASSNWAIFRTKM
jgi:hypothetical protein